MNSSLDINNNMIVYRTKFILPCGNVFYYVGKDMKDNKKYLGSGKLLPWFVKNSIYIQKITIERVECRYRLIDRENFWLKKLNCAENKQYLNIKGYSSGGSLIINTNKWKTSLLQSIPRRIESYKKTRANFSVDKKREISRNISIGVKKAKLRETDIEKKARKKKELLTKSMRTVEQRKRESYLKSQSSKLTAANRSAEEWVLYGKKVSEGVKRYKKSLSKEDKEKIIVSYRTTMYKKNGMYSYISVVRNMIPKKSSLEIFHFLKSQNIKTHHICVKKFIDFLNSYPNIGI